MKKLLFVLCCIATIAATAQTAEEIVQKYASAMGGLDAYSKVKTAKMTGTVLIQGMDLPITIQTVNGKYMRTDVEVMGQLITNVYYNGTGWKINPYGGAPTATAVTGAELNDFRAQAMLASQLMDYKARGSKIEYEGQEEVEGVKTYKVKLIPKDDANETVYYIIAADYMPLKMVTKKEIQGQPMEVETFMSDTKEIEGLKFSMTRIQHIGGQTVQELKLKTIELNVAVDEKIFEMP